MRQVSISKDGINTSVFSYISSYSISALLIVFVIICYYYPVIDKPIQNYLPKYFHMSMPVKIFCLFMVLVITYPVGLIFSWISWALLGFMEKYIETFHFKNRWFLSKGVKNYLCFDSLVKYYKLTNQSFYETCRHIEAELEIKNTELLESLDDTIGVSNLIRHLTLCFLIALVYFTFKLNYIWMLYSFILSVISIVINSIVCLHYSLKVLLLDMKMKEIKQN